MSLTAQRKVEFGMNNRTRTQDQSERGQVLVLAAVSLLVLAVVVFLSINVAYTVRNRIRLQNESDARAYSTAVQEARALNYFAYTNRAIANTYVAMATMHAYMSEAAMMSSADWGMMEGFGIVATCEEGLAAAAAAEWDFGDAIEHEIHAIEAGINAIGYMVSYFDGDLSNKIQKLDSPFNSTMSMLKLHLDALRGSQDEVALAMGAYLALDNGIAEVNDGNMKDPSAGSGVPVSGSSILGARNALFFKSALDITDTKEKKKEMTNVVNATRPPFTWDRNSAAGVALTPENVLLPMTLPGGPIEKAAWIGSSSFVGPIGLLGEMPNLANIISGGRTALNDGNFSPGLGFLSSDAPVSAEGKAITSYDTAVGLAFVWHDCPGASELPAFVIPGPIGAGVMQTKSGGGVHSGDSFMGIDLSLTSSPHKGSKHDWDPDPGKFMEYNINTNADESLTVGPYGQPLVFAKASASLRVSDQGKTGGPWEINPNGVSIDVGGGAQGKGKVVIGDDRADAQAISKAMVYYHRFGDWREPPNLFNPYWRAKLEPWTELDLPEAMGLAGQAGSIPAIEELQLLGKGAVNIK